MKKNFARTLMLIFTILLTGAAFNTLAQMTAHDLIFGDAQKYVPPVSDAAFTAGNIVVCRVGTGAAALGSGATAVFLDEYAAGGTLVQSIALPAAATAPTTGNRNLTVAGSSTSECQIALSPDGKYITLAGYNAAPGLATVASTTNNGGASDVNRVLGRVDGNGAIDTTTALIGTSTAPIYSAGSVRDAVISGTSFYSAGSTAPNLGYTVFGTNTAASVTTGTLRAVNIFGGDLYYDTASVISRFSGLPTSTATPTAFTGATFTNLGGFAFLDVDNNGSIETAYVSDGATLKKFAVSGSVLTAEGTAAITGGNINGLWTRVSGGTVTIYVSSPTTLQSFADASGAGGTLTATSAAIATAATNTAFRGVALAPVATDTTPPTVTSIDDGDADDTVTTNTTLTYTVTFSEDINASTVTAADFDNAGTATINIGTIAETTATSGVFTVQVTPTTVGTLILRIPSGAIISDTAGNNLVTPVQDDTIVTVNAPVNNPPTITPASGVSVVKGTTTNNVTIANVTDDGGNGNVTVTVTSANPSNGVTISNITNTNGTITATITATCAASASSFTLSASDGVNTPVTATLNVGATDSTTATQLAFGTQPSNVNSGAVITPAVTVQALNACGAVVTGFGGAVSVTLNGAGGTLGGTTTVNAVNGVATFSNLTVTTATTGSFTLSASSAGLTGATSNSFTVTAPTPTVNLSIAPATGTEAGQTQFTATVTASAAVSGNQTVNFALTSGTATTADFTAIPATITIPGGSTTGTATFSVVDDAIFEGTENATFTISNPSSGIALGATTTASVSITDNEQQPLASINSVSLPEGNSGTTNFDFTITLDTASAQTVTVNYATANNTATAPSDYTAKTGTATFNPGVTTQTVTVLVNGDTTFEPNETFFVNLTGSSNATIPPATAQGTGTIQNDDAAQAGTIQFNPTTYTTPESGSVSLTVTRTGGTDNAVSATYTINNGSATGGTCGTGGADFNNAGSGGTVNFAAGSSTSQTINVPICADAVDEVDEQFTVTLSAPTGGATLGNATATVTITDDDTAVVTISPTTVNVTEGGATAIFSVSLNSQPTSNVTISLTPDSQETIQAVACLQFGDAAPVDDFAGGTDAVTPGTVLLTFTPANYNTLQCVRVTAVDDTAVEGNHTGSISVIESSSDPNYNGKPIPNVTVNITDNDSAATVTLSQPSCGGLAQNPLAAGSKNDALLCFTLTASNGSATFTALTVPFSSDPSVRFTNAKLYRSTDTNYATTADNTLVASGTITTNSFQFSGYSALTDGADVLELFEPQLASGANNFFVVADVLPTVDGTTPASQPSVSPGNITITGGGTVNGSPATGTNYVFGPAAPTAALVSVGGRVTGKRGVPVEGATVSMIDSEGATRTTAVGADGSYRFENIPVGQTLIFTAHGRGLRFRQPTQVLYLTEETLTVNFTTGTGRGE